MELGKGSFFDNNDKHLYEFHCQVKYWFIQVVAFLEAVTDKLENYPGKKETIYFEHFKMQSV